MPGGKNKGNTALKSKNYKQQELIIPDKLKDVILKTINRYDNIKFKFLFNCSKYNIKEVRNKYNCFIIFINNNNVYFYYDELYQIIEKNENYELVNLKEEENKIFSNFEEQLKVLKDPPKKKKIYLNKSIELKEDLENRLNQKVSKAGNKKEDAIKTLNKKIIKIKFKDLFNKKKDNKCFCFILLSENSLKKIIKFDY